MLSYISQHYITVPCLKDVFLCGNKYTFILFKLLFLCEGSSLEWPKTKKAWTKCWLASGWIFDGDRTTGPSGAQSQAKRSTGGSRQDRTGQ